MHGYNYAASVDNLWSENDKYLLYLLRTKLVDFFYNIMFTALFTYLRMWFAYFIIFNNQSNNKLLDQDPQWIREASLEFQGSQ
jgi:hypothetical protein